MNAKINEVVPIYTFLAEKKEIREIINPAIRSRASMTMVRVNMSSLLL